MPATVLTGREVARRRRHERPDHRRHDHRRRRRPRRCPTALRRVDLTGYVLLPSAVEPHAHLDKAFLAELVVNETGDLYGAIEAMKASRHLTNVADTIERAERAARLMASQRVQRRPFARRHHPGEPAREHRGAGGGQAPRRRRDRSRDRGALVVADHRARRALRSAACSADALDAGADLVGGCPHLEAYSGDGDIESATDVLLQIATDHGRAVDLHTDETLDPNANGLDLLADRVLAGFDLGATASHCVSLGQQPLEVQRSTAERVAEAGISVVVLPHTNLFLQGRGQFADATRVDRDRDAPRRRRQRRRRRRQPAGSVQPGRAGMPVRDRRPDGDGRPRPAGAGMAVGQFRRRHGDGPARRDRPGAPADLIAVRAGTVREAIAFGPSDRIVWRNGQRVSITRTTSLV